MKNRITTTITTMMLMLFCSSINVFAQSENVVPSGYPELDEWVKQCKVERPILATKTASSTASMTGTPKTRWRISLSTMPATRLEIHQHCLH